MAIDACGWYPAMEAIRITDDPFLRCGAAACNNKNSTSTPPSKKKKKLWNLSIEKHRTHLQQQNRSLHIDVPKLIEDRLFRLQYVIYRRIGRRIGHNYIYMTIFLQQNPQLILKKIKLLPLNLKKIVSFSFTWTVFSMRSFRCWGFETWQTTPKTSIPLDLSLSTASSTFLYSSKGGKKKSRTDSNWIRWVSNFDLLSRGDDDGGAFEAEPLGDGEPDSLSWRRHDCDFAL